MLRIDSRVVVTHATFGLLAVAAFWESSNLPRTYWIRIKTVIVAKGADCFSRLHTKHCHIGIVHWIVIVSINKCMYSLYKNLSKIALSTILRLLWGGSHLLKFLVLFSCTWLSFWLGVKWHATNSWVTQKSRGGPILVSLLVSVPIPVTIRSINIGNLT